MASANDLIVVFLGLEILSIALYTMAGYQQRREGSQEAAIKYFVLGAFSSAFFLYGIALVYGTTGSTNLGIIAEFLRVNALTNGLLLAGFALLIVGLGFKVAAVPFHMWTPDVYQGSPTPATAFMAAAAKAAVFAALLRIFVSTFDLYKLDWQPIVWALAVLSLLVGSILAVVQNDVKRMLAYSSIAHAGYLIIGLVAGTSRGISAMLIYLLIYSFMQLGAFAVIVMMRRADIIGDELKDLSGLSFRQPFAAFAMLLFMLSLGGIPPTAGFMGMFWLFGAAIDSGYVWLAVIGVLNSAISLYYYIRIVVFMYLRKETTGSEPVMGPALTVTLALAVAATLILGIYPRQLFDAAETSAAAIVPKPITAAAR